MANILDFTWGGGGVHWGLAKNRHSNIHVWILSPKHLLRNDSGFTPLDLLLCTANYWVVSIVGPTDRFGSKSINRIVVLISAVLIFWWLAQPLRWMCKLTQTCPHLHENDQSGGYKQTPLSWIARQTWLTHNNFRLMPQFPKSIWLGYWFVQFAMQNCL